MGVMPENKLLLNMALPMIISMLIQACYNVVDSYFVAKLSQDALNAVSLAFPVQNLMIAVAVGTGVGINALLSRSLGQKDFTRANRTAMNGVLLEAVSGLVFTVLGLTCARQFYIIQTDIPGIISYGADYLTIIAGCSMGIFMSVATERLVQATGRTVYAMVIQGTGSVINLILDPIFIFTLRMGVRGAALATVIAQTCSAVWVLVFLTGRKAVLRLEKASLGLELPILKRVCGLGLTGFTFSVTNSLVQALGNAQLQAYGTAAGMGDLYVAAMTAIVSVREIVFQPIRGLTQGAQPVIGYNYGAGKYSRVRESIRFLTAACLSYNILVWVLLLAFPRVFILLFNDDPALLEVGVKTMRIYYAAYVMMSFQMIGQNTFVALGRARNAVFFSLFRKVILVVPMMLLLPRLWNLGVYGVFASEPVSDVIGGGACFITMMCTVWKDMKRPDEDPA